MSSMKKGLRRVAAVAVATLVVAPALATVASATSTFAFDRLAGADRYATAVKVASTYGTSSSVILANGTNAHTVDALAAAYLAGVKHAPILLTTTDTTPTNVVNAITASGASTVYILGGTATVSNAQEAALDAKFGTVTRLGGADRFVTAQKVIEAAGAAGAAKTAIVATGMNFPDALGAGALSYVKGMPIGITWQNSLPASTLAALKGAGVTNAIVLGGPTVVGQGVLDALVANGIALSTAAGVTAGRIYGLDRGETSSKVANFEIATQGFSNTGVNVASGDAAVAGADALGGAALSGKEVRPTLITNSPSAPSAGVLAFLTEHAATLTTGHIFGGFGAVTAAAEATMTAAAGAVTSNQTFTVIANTANSTFTYADPVTGTTKTATFSSTDVFMVDGVTATEAFFVSQLSPGDLVTILANTPTTGVTTYKLVNKLAADYASGLVGPVNTSATVYSVIDPITGTKLSGNIDYNGTDTIWTLNGAASTLAAISLAINEGDTIVSTGTGADATHIRTIALTNTTVTGTASGIVLSAGPPYTAAAFFVDTAAGASLGDVVNDGTVSPYVLTSAASMTVDGVSATVDEFAAALSAGDTVTYARAAGVQTVALTNKAPLAIHGQIVGVVGALTSFSYVPAGDTLKSGVSATGLVLTVDGVLATGAEFAAAFTLGDTVVYQAADTTTSTTGSLALTNAKFSGTVDKGVNTSVSDTIGYVGVLAAGSTVPLGAVNYDGTLDNKMTGTPVYTVNGVVKNVTEFGVYLTSIKSGSLTGTIVVTQTTGLIVTFALTTAVA